MMHKLNDFLKENDGKKTISLDSLYKLFEEVSLQEANLKIFKGNIPQDIEAPPADIIEDSFQNTINSKGKEILDILKGQNFTTAKTILFFVKSQLEKVSIIN